MCVYVWYECNNNYSVFGGHLDHINTTYYYSYVHVYSGWLYNITFQVFVCVHVRVCLRAWLCECLNYSIWFVPPTTYKAGDISSPYL